MAANRERLEKIKAELARRAKAEPGTGDAGGDRLAAVRAEVEARTQATPAPSVPVQSGTPAVAGQIAQAANIAPPGGQPEVGTFIDPLLQGFSLGSSDEAEGALAGAAAFLTGDEFGEAFKRRQAEAEARAAGFRERNPGTSAALEIGAGLLVPAFGVAGTAARGGLTALRAATAGAAAGGTQGFFASEEDTLGGRARDAAIGAGIGGAAGGILQGAGRAVAGAADDLFGGPGVTRAARSVSRETSEGTEELAGRVSGELNLRPRGDAGVGGATRQGNRFQQQVERLTEEGVDLTPGQRSGNVAQKTLDETAAPTLFGRGVRETFERQHTQVQSSLMRRAGFDADDINVGSIDPDTVQRAQERFSRRYSEALDDETVDLSTEAFSDRISDIAETHRSFQGFEQRARVDQIADDFLNQTADTALSGPEYQRIRSRLGTLSSSTSQNDPAISGLYRQLRDTLDDAFAQSAGDATSQLKRAIDRDYRNFKVLQKASQRAGQGVSEGQLPFRTLAGLARNAKRPATRDFRDLIDAADAVIPSGTPNSGTPTRLLQATGDIGGTLTAGLTNRALSSGITAGQTAGLGRGVSPATSAVGGTLATGLPAALIGAAQGQQSPDDELLNLVQPQGIPL